MAGDGWVAGSGKSPVLKVKILWTSHDEPLVLLHLPPASPLAASMKQLSPCK